MLEKGLSDEPTCSICQSKAYRIVRWRPYLTAYETLASRTLNHAIARSKLAFVFFSSSYRWNHWNLDQFSRERQGIGVATLTDARPGLTIQACNTTSSLVSQSSVTYISRSCRNHRVACILETAVMQMFRDRENRS